MASDTTSKRSDGVNRKVIYKDREQALKELREWGRGVDDKVQTIGKELGATASKIYLGDGPRYGTMYFQFFDDPEWVPYQIAVMASEIFKTFKKETNEHKS